MVNNDVTFHTGIPARMTPPGADVITRSIPSHIFFTTFLDLSSVRSLCQVNHTWATKNRVALLVLSVFVRENQPLAATEISEIIKHSGIKTIPSLPIYSFVFIQDHELKKVVELMPRLQTLYLTPPTFYTRGKDLNWIKSAFIIQDHNLEGINQLTALQNLDFGRLANKITDRGVATLNCLTSLFSLKLTSCTEVTEVGIASLSDLTALQTLDLSSCQITDLSSMHIANRFPSLRDLNLSGCKITDETIYQLGIKLNSLQSLNLSGCQRISNKSLSHLSNKIPSLHHLDLGGCRLISDEGIVHLSALTCLRHLNFNRLWQSDPAITDEATLTLSNLTSLEKLGLSFSRITDVGLCRLSRVIGLRNLDLMGCPISIVGVASLISLTALQSLNLPKRQLNFADVRSSLSALLNLKITGR